MAKKLQSATYSRPARSEVNERWWAKYSKLKGVRFDRAGSDSDRRRSLNCLSGASTFQQGMILELTWHDSLRSRSVICVCVSQETDIQKSTNNIHEGVRFFSFQRGVHFFLWETTRDLPDEMRA